MNLGLVLEFVGMVFGVWGRLVGKGLGRSTLGKNMQDLPGRKCSVCYERELLVLGRNRNTRGSLELGIDRGGQTRPRH